MKPPFSYYGGKTRFASIIWQKFNHVDIYVEPFAGSLAVLLGNPYKLPKHEIICDTDGFICNFWRAIQADPDKVAYHADWPSFHHDLTARRRYLANWGKNPTNQYNLTHDPNFYDAQIAGWWVWEIVNWIGRDYLTLHPDRDDLLLPNTIPTLRSERIAANSKTYMGEVGDGSRLKDYFHQIAQRLANCTVLNRSWENSLTSGCLFLAERERFTRGIFLDPPYILHEHNSRGHYRDYNVDVAEQSYEWAVKNGDELQIAYACHLGDFDIPPGWTYETLSFSSVFKVNKDKHAKLDCVMFSPACEKTAKLF